MYQGQKDAAWIVDMSLHNESTQVYRLSTYNLLSANHALN